MNIKPRLTAIGVATAIFASASSMVAVEAQAGKFLIAWASDQMLDGNNCSALDDVLGLRGLNPGGAIDPNAPATPSSPVDCQGLLPDADFLAVIDAKPNSPTYGKVVNTAEMPGVAGQHLLSVTENFVDNALDLAIANANDPNHPGNPNGTRDLAGLTSADIANSAYLPDFIMTDLLGGVPNFFHPAFGGPGNGPLGALPPVVPAPSSVLNESHHHSVFPTVDNGKVYTYYGGIISANTFGCDVTDPMNIVPAPNTELEDLPLHGDNTTNLCGLAVSGAVYNAYTGTDDLEYNPITGSYFTTMIGAGGGDNAAGGNFSGPSGGALSLPPVLTTPGGMQEIEPLVGSVNGGVTVFEYSAIPRLTNFGAQYDSVYGHGWFTGNGPAGTISDASGFYANTEPGAMLGPKRYAPRGGMVAGGLDGNGECTGAVGDTAIADPATGFATQIQAFNLCVPGVAPFNQLGPDTGAVDLPKGINEGPDTGLLAHLHGIGLRQDLNATIYDSQGNPLSTSTGIIMTSDYVDPVSLALGGSGIVGANNHNLGTTIRLWDLARPQLGPYQVIQMPNGNRHEDRWTMEEPEGLMAMRTTHGSTQGAHPTGSKGAFVASMCGGTIFYSADITVPKPEFRIVYDFGACVGASVFTLTQDDNFMFLPISGIQVAGDPTHDRDYDGEHDRRIAVLDLRPLMAKGNDMSNVQCDMAPAWAFANVPQFLADAYPVLKSSLGEGLTLGAGIFPYIQFGDLNNFGNYWPNNSAFDCPRLVDRVDFSGDGDDGIFGTKDDHPDNETSRGGPHFTIHDRNDKFIATSNYFIDLRNYAIKDVGLLLEALGLGQAWCDAAISADTSTTYYPNLPGNIGKSTGPSGHGHPPGGPNDGDTSPGGLGAVFDILGVPGMPNGLDGAVAHIGENVACHSNGASNILPGTGSVGDDTVCMMKWNRNKRNLKLHNKFNKGDPNSPKGCIDLDFGDTGALWPANGTRNPGAGNAKPHGMSFIKEGSTRFFTNGTTP